MWKRNCPECEMEIVYKHKTSWSHANNIKSLCASCAVSGERSGMFGKKHSHNTKNKMSNFRKEYLIKNPYTDEIKRKMSKSALNMSEENKQKISQKGRKRSNETKQKLTDSHMGQIPWNKGKIGVYSDETLRGWRLSRIKEIQEKHGQIMPNYNPSSIPIIRAEAKQRNIFDLQDAETDAGEHHIKELGYWVDGYSKEKNVVIEYYEKHHEKQKDKDLKRQKEIEEFLGCKFIVLREIK